MLCCFAGAEDGSQKGPREDAASLLSLSGSSTSILCVKSGLKGSGGAGVRGSKSPVGGVPLGRVEGGGVGGRKGGSKIVDSVQGGLGEEARVKVERGRPTKVARTAGGGKGGLDMDVDAMLGVHTLMMLANNSV